MPRDDDRDGDLDWLSAQLSDDPIAEAPLTTDAPAAATQDDPPPAVDVPDPDPTDARDPNLGPVLGLAPVPDLVPVPGLVPAPAAQTPPVPWWTTPMVSAWAPAPAESRDESRPAVSTPGAGPGSMEPESVHPAEADGSVAAGTPGTPATPATDTAMPQPLRPLVIRAPLVNASEATPVAALRHSSSRQVGIQGARPSSVSWALIGIAGVIVLAALFFVGRGLGAGAPVAVSNPTSTPSVTTTPTATPAAVVTAIQPPGVHAWNSLFGGECLEPFASPWNETFTVVDCGAAHTAQLVYRGSLAGETTTAFPGEAPLAAHIDTLCSVAGVIDLTAAAALTDVQVQGSYPVTGEQWAAGARYYYCFVSRSSGEPLTTTLAGPGPTV